MKIAGLGYGRQPVTVAQIFPRAPMNAICNILCLLFFLSGLGAMIAFRIFWARLRKQHAEAWEHLGRPLTILHPRFVKYLWRREYESLPDLKLVAFGRFLRAYFISSMILGALTVLSLYIFASSSGFP